MGRSGQGRVASGNRPGVARLRPAAATLALLLGLIALSALDIRHADQALAQQAAPLPPLAPTQSSTVFQKQPGGMFGTPKKIDKAQPLLLNANELIYDTRGNRVIARGNVEAYYNEYVLTADQVIYDQTANTLTAEGNAFMKEPNGNVVRASRLVTSADFAEAFVQRVSVVSKDQSRIAADQATRRDGNVMEYQNGKFTPCRSEGGAAPLWCISAARILHDQQAATITYQNAQFEFMGVPVLGLPYFQHPDPSVKRRSGFLVPEVRHSEQLGFQIEIPYFFALAANYDFLFHPLYTSKQGILWQGDWRHRVAFGDVTGTYSVKIAAIDQNDANEVLSGPLSQRWRGSLETKGQFSLSSWWKFGWDLTFESDDSFRRFYKLDSVLQTDRVNTVYLEGMSKRNYFSATLYHFGGLLLDDTPHAESLVHPVIDYNYILDKQVLGGELSFAGNALSLSRSDGTDVTRASAEMRWRRNVIDDLGQVWTPYLAARGDVHRFSSYVDPNSLAPVPDEVVTRAMGTAALTYSFPFIMNNAVGGHVLEPIAQVVARPSNVSQRVTPDEDARSLVWDDTLLFDPDKFSGWDRIETGTRINTGVQYTFQAKNGGYARIIAGQSFHVAGNNPYTDPGLLLVNGQPVHVFSARSGLDTDRSDYVLGAYLAPVEQFRIVAQMRFDESDLALKRANIYSHARLGPLYAQGQYSFTQADPLIQIAEAQHELLGALTLSLTEHWSLTATMRYDIDASMRLQDSIAVNYRDDCFVLTAQYTETFIENPALGLRDDRTIMLRFELKHLGQFRYNSGPIQTGFTENQPPRY